MSFEHIHQVKTLIPRSELRALMVRSDWQAWFFLVQHLFFISVTGILVSLSMGTWLLVPAMTIHGVGIVHLFSPQHEFAHRTAFRTRWLNDFFGWIFGLAILLPNVYFRWEHTAHHSFTQNPTRDPQFIPTPKNLFEYFFYLSTIPYWRGFLVAFSRHLVGKITKEDRRFVPSTERWKIVVEAWVMLLIYVAIAIGMVIVETTAPLYYWLFPRLLAEPYMRFVRMTEHVARPVNNVDLLENTRTTLVSYVANALAWNMPFHSEHHLSPAVPFHALPKLHREIANKQKDTANGYLDAHKAILNEIHANRKR